MDVHVSIFLQRPFWIQPGDEQMNQGKNLSGDKVKKKDNPD